MIKLIRSEKTASRSVQFDKLVRSEETASRFVRFNIVKASNFQSVYSMKITSHSGELNVLPERQGGRFDDPYGLYRGLTN